MQDEARQQTAITEIVRPELKERGLSDPLEFLYVHMPEFSDSERVSLLSYSLEAEGQAFEVQCCLCAQYAEGRRLREFIERYNRQAQENGSKVISYQYARVMSRIGNKMIAEGLRMTVDFPALSPSYYVAALDAKDFASALNHAQEAVTAHQARPQEVPKYTIRAFKDELHPDRASRRTQSRQTPETINQASVVASPATASVETAEEEQEPAPKPVGATCYDCRYCWQPHDYHRLAVVNTKGSAAIDLMMEPVPVWICRKHKTVISVRTQVYARAEALARSCPNYQRVEINLEPPERESSHDGDMESGDDVGLVVGPEELDAALEEVS